MAIEHLTPHHPEPDALQAIMEVDACVTQARAIVRLMGAAPAHEGLHPDALQNAAWAVSDLLARIDKATGKLGRLASARES